MPANDDRRAILTIKTGDLQANLSDAFHIRTLRGAETISQLFRFDLVLVTTESGVKTSQLIGQNVTISLLRNDGAPASSPNYRYINGIVSQASRVWSGGEGSTADPLYTFHATVVPDTWTLTKTSRSRVFDGKSAWEIAADIVPDTSAIMDANDVINGRSAQGRPIEEHQRQHCIQYRESDLNFVSRLLEEEGISYYYKHTDSSHQLVLTDGSTGFEQCVQEGAITKITEQEKIKTSQYVVHDYKFTEPSFTFEASEGAEGSLIDDFPGTFGTRDDVLKVEHVHEIAMWRFQEENADRLVLAGTSESVTFAAGASFRLNAPGSEHHDGDFLLIAVNHDLKQPPPRGTQYTDGDPATANTYTNTYACVPKSVVYRPPRATPKPRVEGPQTAIVEGPASAVGNVHTDEFGRVKVTFHWDDRSGGEGSRSAWVRVSEGWAGAQHGTVFIPHVGDEVIVNFLEGNPDRPIVTGRVYNNAALPVRGVEGGTGALDPHRSIIQDIAGNQIVMDSMPGSESIKLRSPNGESVLVLGKQRGASPAAPSTPIAVTATTGNSEVLQTGNKFEGTRGSKGEVLIGNKYEFQAGFSLSGVAGGGIAFRLGPGYEAGVGPSYSYKVGQDVGFAEGSKRDDFKKDRVITSMQTISLVGGFPAKGAVKPKTSIVELSSKFARISVGENKDDEVKEPWKYVRWVLFLGVVGSLLGKGVSDLVRKDMVGDAVNDTAFGTDANTVSTSVNIALVAIGVALGFLDRQVATKLSHADEVGDKPNAMLELEKDGSIVLAGTLNVDIRAATRVVHDQVPAGAELISTTDGPRLFLDKTNSLVSLVLNEKKNSEGSPTSSLEFYDDTAELAGQSKLVLVGRDTIDLDSKTSITLTTGGAIVELTSAKLSVLGGNLEVAK